MYSRQEASMLRQQFWTTFGQYMTPVLSSEGEKINWINYKTGQKDILFRMNASGKNATIGIELQHKDDDIRQLYFDQFLQFKSLLHDAVGEDWNWVLHDMDENGKTGSRIYKELSAISVFKKEDWPALISFFKPRIIALDEFWSSVKYTFQSLA